MNKKQICFIVLSFLMITAKAQESSVFIKGAFNLANVSITDDGTVDDAKALSTFQVGLQGDISIIKNLLFIQPGLFFTGKGSKIQNGQKGTNGYFLASTNPFYLELPVNVVIKAPLGDGNKFFAGAGPYLAMGIAGKRKLEYQALNLVFKRTDNIQFSNDDPSTTGEEGAGYGIVRRFDYGLNGTIGFEGKTAMFSVNYGLGLAKLQSGTNSNTDNNNKHRVVSIAVGFRL